ncbi:pyrroloquinoline quinone biosynthesis peptide chaperone PqqD [Noviherbaspirillum pedocola]|uniref:Pyrroloquinoline quinone biosynthesis peptide chaperone PqqD n=1 Tax=Noviherbaspirillum pedocola TaxID=2801341 RepID=A0A934SWD4_9BURK|nr:pyrroloquinoline quinone biosynthesis peptide chaperone PqqD [Noviherbaspirillum pedocola]MBK4738046.1 pyrroloquinoline quinone biosynthesis peptide chaperone PqqD [Noviherbaspirillum pedocola]
MSTPADTALPAAPHLNRRFRLQWEEAQQSFVLLYPEGMVRLNRPAAEILKRCDGARNVDAIVASLEHDFNASGLRGDVLGFLAHAQAQGWLA